jgi:uncharacterized membrane protein YdbT with pleckstrin-like domain
MLLLRTRGISLSTAVIPKGRIQWCGGQQSPIQIRSGLSKLLIAVASQRQFHMIGLEWEASIKTLEWIRAKDIG